MSQQEDQSQTQPSSQESCIVGNELNDQDLLNIGGGAIIDPWGHTPIDASPRVPGDYDPSRLGPTHWADPNELARRLKPIADAQASSSSSNLAATNVVHMRPKLQL